MGLSLPLLDGTASAVLNLAAGSADHAALRAAAGALQAVESDGSTLTTLQAAAGVAGDDLVTKNQLDAAASPSSVRTILVPFTTSTATSTAEIPAGARVLAVTVRQIDAGAGPVTVGRAGALSAYLASSSPTAGDVTHAPQVSDALVSAAAVVVTPSASGSGVALVQYATADT